MERIVSTPEVGGTDGTWAQAVRCGGLLFISGQIGCDSQGNAVGPDFASQARRALDNLMSMLRTGGAEPERLASITVFVTDMANRPQFAQIRQDYFLDNPPASTIVEVKALCSPELLIEINGVAVLD